MNTYFVSQAINGSVVPSSAIHSGSLASCRSVARRLNKDCHPDVSWVILPCVE